MDIKFILRQYINTAVHHFFLPAVYRIYCKKPVRKGSVIFADGHHETIPYSMVQMYDYLQSRGYHIQSFFSDFGKASYMSGLKSMIRFMKAYAEAECVFLCDYYLPAGSCRKRKETQVVQLWHACGALKKFGYDAEEDISSFYKGNSMKNCTLVTVSSKICEPIYARAFGIPKQRVKALGVSRTDRYFSEDYKAVCREKFYKECPGAKGKKIILWAPTFRGNARMPKLQGAKAIDMLERTMEDCFVVRKLHPHMEGKCGHSICSMGTEEVMAAGDILITDYSSIIFDFMIYDKPIVLFAPDAGDYTADRGFYTAYDQIPFFHADNEAVLAGTVRRALKGERASSRETYDCFYKKYMEQCDGRATERIVQEVFKDGRK